MLEVLVLGGMELHRAVRMLVPPAWQNVGQMDRNLRAFYEYNGLHMEPWDGPAGLVLTDGRYAVCTLDRNGLRPSRWVITKDDFITVASEVGVYDYKPEDVVAKGRLGPGQILSVDTQDGKLYHTDDIDNQLMSRQPYKQWLRENALRIKGSLIPTAEESAVTAEELNRYMKQFSVSFEERDQVLRPMAEAGQEATGSMGDDTPMAVLSQHNRSLYDYFRQQFAQVTNPPIDPLREAIVMSLETCFGPESNIFEELPNHAKRIITTTPVLSTAKFQGLLDTDGDHSLPSEIFSLLFDPQKTDLKTAIQTLCAAVEKSVRSGTNLVVLTDRGIEKGKLPIHALMATGAVHHHLIKTGLRCSANILVETATARDPHQFACLIGLGATAIHPYLSYRLMRSLIDSGELVMETWEAYKNYRKGINKGLQKILSKMGISAIACLLYTSPSPRDRQKSRMPSSA